MGWLFIMTCFGIKSCHECNKKTTKNLIRALNFDFIFLFLANAEKIDIKIHLSSTSTAKYLQALEISINN